MTVNVIISNGYYNLQDMWLGVLHHVVGEHVWSDGQCSHGPLTAAETAKPLLEKGSKAMEALTKVIFDKKWLESLIFCVVQVSRTFCYFSVVCRCKSNYCTSL